MKSMKTLFKIDFVIALVIAAAYLTGNMSVFSYAQAAVNYLRDTLAFGYEQIKMLIASFSGFSS